VRRSIDPPRPDIADDADLRIGASKNFLKNAIDETRTDEARLRPAPNALRDCTAR
jgi:hypothetical protein